ncbi:MAG: hypothetical protein OJF50_001428 [Nitrospira sp.]|nr:hypothetical protein [Nitrospira sp.]
MSNINIIEAFRSCAECLWILVGFPHFLKKFTVLTLMR